MPSGVNLRLEGYEAVEKAFRRLEGPDQKKLVRASMRDGVKVVRDQAKARVPVRTGKLKAGIKVRALRRSRTRLGIRVTLPTREELGLPSSTPGYYPASVEFGRRTKDGRRVGAKPFLRPAWDESKERMMRVFATSLGRRMQQLWAKN